MSSNEGAESTNGYKYKRDPCLLKPACNCLSIIFPSWIEGSSIAKNPNNKLVLGFRTCILSRHPLDLPLGIRPLLTAIDLASTTRLFPRMPFAAMPKVWFVPNAKTDAHALLDAQHRGQPDTT